jgi:putative NADPH-quinone reductase
MTRRAFVLYAHPVPDSFCAAVHAETLQALDGAGWQVDDCDLYAEEFDPRLSRAEREGYHEVGPNLAPVADYVDRLRAAEALVMVFPVWNFGSPAILKGFFDRVFLPGVSFDIADGKVRPALSNIRTVAAATTYGAMRLRAFLAGDPPRKVVMRPLRYVMHKNARVSYTALYDMNNADAAARAAHLARVRAAMAAL